jgi:rSAM/selenodomain-associated transferase 2
MHHAPGTTHHAPRFTHYVSRITHWFSWPRLLGVMVTVALLWFALRNVHLHEVWGVMRRVNLWVFVAGLLAYEIALVLAAYVWHVALRGVGCAAHSLATSRFALIGHFFFVALFGAIGCDLAKSGVYARWFRFGLPEVLAAAPLERALRGVGAVILGIIFVLIGAFSGGTATLSRLRFALSPWWIGLTALCVAALVLAFRYCKPQGQGFISRLRRALRAGVTGLFRDRALGVNGVTAAVLAQTATSAVFALSLAGVTSEPLPWARMAWTFPTIAVVSCLPFTVAGTGVREVASVMFLGIYGVSAVNAVAASLLTLVQKIILALVGVAAWWREEALQQHSVGSVSDFRISVVIPTLNEAAFIEETVKSVRAAPEVGEIIVVDGGSRDGTVQIAERLGCETFRTAPSRGGQMRLGASHAKGSVILFLHADTLLPTDGGKAILRCLHDPTVVGGGFWKRFQRTPPPLLGARFKCLLRLLVARRVFGDQGLFVRRDALEKIGGVPDLPLMEEVELCKRLSKIGRLALADATVIASERRFRRCGYLRTTWLTWKISILYRMGASPADLVRMYRPADRVSETVVASEHEPVPVAPRKL